MAVVRCPVHKIPYNDENPRGCPACARERSRDETADVIRELARASRAARSVEQAPSAATPVGELLTPPPAPVPERPGWLERARSLTRDRPFRAWGVVAIAMLIVVLILVSGPRYVEAPVPAPAAGELRPLSINPEDAITTVFAVLGPQQPEPVPDRPRLARYRYGTDLTVDALNDRVDRITFRVPNRRWNMLAVGDPELTVRGAMTLLGTVEEETPAPPQPPQSVSGYEVYESLGERPLRTLRAAVRPPNGCYDVEVDLRPRVAGLLLDGSNRYAVIGKGDVTLEWVSTEVRIQRCAP